MDGHAATLERGEGEEEEEERRGGFSQHKTNLKCKHVLCTEREEEREMALLNWEGESEREGFNQYCAFSHSTFAPGALSLSLSPVLAAIPFQGGVII